jgi:hypothetical protein
MQINEHRGMTSWGLRKESFQVEIILTIQKRSGGCVSCKGWKDFGI